MLLSILFVPQAISVSFDFDFSQPSGYKAANLILQGDAQMVDKVIELTGKGLENSAGRASYSEPVAIWDESTGELASFTTVFSFQILPQTNLSSGDGMAFFLAHYPSIIPATSGGGGLGLFTWATTNATGDNRAVAVEFDTFNNDVYDNSNNHIGIDVNSLISRAYNNTNAPGRNLTSGLVMICEISYGNNTQRLAADLQIGNTSYHVDSVVDLRQVLPSVVAVGFSAGSGFSTEIHQVLAWSFNSTLDGPGAPSHSTSPFSKIITWKAVVIVTGAVVLVAVVVVVVTIAAFVYLWGQSRRKNNTGYETPPHVARCFSYQELAEATHNFAEEQKLGEGGYACVYRGELANPSRSVAVKRFKPGTSSSIGMRAFEDEIKVISHVRHRNLVELVGWCNDAKKNCLLLVYELVTEGNPDEHLHGARSWLVVVDHI
jgi:interleukin-1 receptor-associated kinase 1